MVPEVNPSKRDVVAAGLHRLKLHRLVQRDTIELGVMIRRAVEIDDLLEEAAGLGAGNQFIGDAAIGERERDLGLVDDLAELAGAQHRHGVDDDGACLGRRKPCRDQRRIVARADQDTIAGLDAVILDQRMRQPVRPVREFLVGTLAAIADQRDTIAHSLLDDAIRQFDRGVEIIGILKLGPVEQHFRPLLRRRKVSPREIIDVARRAKASEFYLTFPSPLAFRKA